MVNDGKCRSMYHRWILWGIYVGCGPLAVTKVFSGLGQDPRMKNAIILVVTSIPDKHTQCITCKLQDNRQSPYPTMKGSPSQPVGKGLGVCSKGVLKQLWKVDFCLGIFGLEKQTGRSWNCLWRSWNCLISHGIVGCTPIPTSAPYGKSIYKPYIVGIGGLYSPRIPRTQ